MDINALYAYLREIGPTLLLQASDINLQPEFQAFIATMPGRKIIIATGTDGLTLVGNVLTIQGTSADTWDVQGMVGLELSLSTMHIVIDAAEVPAAISGTGRASMPFTESDTADVVITFLPQEGHPWQITLADDVTGVTPMDAILLGNPFGLPFPIPPGMDFLNDALVVDKEHYAITFYPNSDEDAYYAFVLNAPSATWTPVPGIFSFDGLDIAATLKTRSAGINIIGHVMVGTVGVDAGIGMSGNPNWRVFIRPTPPAEAFPGLAAFASWIGGAELSNSVSEGFESVDISTAGFDAAISAVYAGININTWTLDYLNIQSLLSIGALQLDVNMKLPELYINGGLHNQEALKVTDLLTSLSLPASTVPDDLTVSKANFVTDLYNSIYSIQIVVDNLWQAGPFSFDQVSLALSYNPIDSLTGSFGCQFTICDSAVVMLIAEYGGTDAGWVFSGGLAPGTELNVGDIITMLAADFGISNVPEPIRTLVMTELWVAYSSATNSFEFTCAGTFTVSDVAVDMEVVIRLSSQSSGYEGEGDPVVGSKGYNAYFGGTITIDNLVFDLVFDTNSMSADVFVAAYHNTGEGHVPLRDLVAGVSTSIAAWIPPSLVIDLKEVKFIYLQQNQVKQFAFGLQLGASINLKDLPVIGDKLPDNLTIGIDALQVLFASALFTKEQVAIINPLLPEGILPLTTDGLSKGLLISGSLNILGYQLPLNSGTKPAVEQAPVSFAFSGAVAAADGAVAPSDITWFNVQKQLGPMKFQRIGIAFAEDVLSFALDATLTLGPASLAMQGLTVGSPLSTFAPVFGIQGFFMDIKSGGLELGGGFLRSNAQDGAIAYYGAVIVRFGTFSLKALGGDTPAHEADDPNHPGQKIQIPASFFIYANIEVPLGGPPYLYVNGFAGGFGINNLLKLPTLENLPGYILLPGAGSKAPAQEESAEATIAKVLPQMQEYFVAMPGQYWMAAGISFSSFQMINAFALVTVSFGVDFQIALLGSCSMHFPTGAPDPIAYVEIDILASFSPATGLLAVEGILSPASYIFGSYCQLSGGFAFYIWFNPPVVTDGPRPGDFVVTLGGYHPAFTRPDYYPKVPRLGINFSLGPFQVIGKSYFALTPGMFMAGGSLNATWNLDIVKAWFTIGADFLIAWAPFHYEAVVYVSVGCSIDLGLFTLNVSVGADLQLWGPPFGGVANVDLDVISFTISFGEPAVQPSPVGWQDFKTQFLPGDTAAAPKKQGAGLALAEAGSSTTNIIKASVPTGLNSSDIDGQDWILDPDHFGILISTTIPVNKPQWADSASSFKPLSNDAEDYNKIPPPVSAADWPYLVFTDSPAQMDEMQIWNPVVNIKPMKLNEVESDLSVSIIRMDNAGNFTTYITALTLVPAVQDSAGALWDTHTGKRPAPNDPSFLKSSLSGFTVMPLPRLPNVVNDILLIQLLFQQNNNYDFNYQQQVLETGYNVSATGTDTDVLTIAVTGEHTATLVNNDYVLNALIDPWVTEQRNALLSNFNLLGFQTYDTATLGTFATLTALTDWPEVMLLSDTLPQS